MALPIKATKALHINIFMRSKIKKNVSSVITKLGLRVRGSIQGTYFSNFIFYNTANINSWPTGFRLSQLILCDQMCVILISLGKYKL